MLDRYPPDYRLSRNELSREPDVVQPKGGQAMAGPLSGKSTQISQQRHVEPYGALSSQNQKQYRLIPGPGGRTPALCLLFTPSVWPALNFRRASSMMAGMITLSPGSQGGSAVVRGPRRGRRRT
jgi:hypothetical protein